MELVACQPARETHPGSSYPRRPKQAGLPPFRERQQQDGYNGSSADGGYRDCEFSAPSPVLRACKRDVPGREADASQVRADDRANDAASTNGEPSEPAEPRRASGPDGGTEPPSCPDRSLPPATCRRLPARSRRLCPRRRIPVRSRACPGGRANGRF